MPMHDMHSRRMQAQQLMIVWCMRSRRVVYNIYHIDLNELPARKPVGFHYLNVLEFGAFHTAHTEKLRH